MLAVDLQSLPPRSQEKCRAIIDAAQSLFLESGFGATSMDAVADKAGVSKRTVYSHFDSKTMLFGNVMTNMCTLMGSGDTSFHDSPPEATEVGEYILCDLPDVDIRETLMIIGRRFLALITQPESVALFRVVIAEADRFPELGDAFFKHGPQPLTNRLAGLFEEQHEAGALAIDDAYKAAWRFLSLVKEPIHMNILLGQAETPTDAEIDSLVADAVDAFLSIHGT